MVIVVVIDIQRIPSTPARGYPMFSKKVRKFQQELYHGDNTRSINDAINDRVVFQNRAKRSVKAIAATRDGSFCFSSCLLWGLL